MLPPKVLITAKEVHPLISSRLSGMGYEVDILPEPELKHLLHIIPAYEGIVFTTYTKVNQELMSQATQLRWVARVGSGLENVDLQFAATKNIQVFSSPEGNANAVGEHALSLLLNLMNNISLAHEEVKNGIWKREENRGEELDGKTVGIIGYGHTGTAFAKKLRGFDVKVLAYDKFKTVVSEHQVQNSSLLEIQENADVISVHIPYSEENHHLVSKDFFYSLQKPVYLLHTCRGEVLDTKAALEALNSGKIKGLGIDVFEDEPWTKATLVSKDIYNQLLQHPQVIATPHIAGWTIESKWKLAEVLMNKIENWLGMNGSIHHSNA